MPLAQPSHSLYNSDACSAFFGVFFDNHRTDFMHISWLGTTAIRLQVKPFDTDINIVIDPYKPNLGSFPRSLTADIALYTRGEKDSVTVSGNPFVMTTAGEVETKSVLIASVQGHEKDEKFFRLDVEGLSVAHLGLANKELTAAQLEVLSGVDILFVPIGDIDCYGARSAVKAIQEIEPRIVIPMAFQSDNDPNAKDEKGFTKELGIPAETTENKVIIKQKDLPQEETRVILLSKE